jgi:hypothetical protein
MKLYLQGGQAQRQPAASAERGAPHVQRGADEEAAQQREDERATGAERRVLEEELRSDTALACECARRSKRFSPGR